MGFMITSTEYVDYLMEVKRILETEKDYLSSLDAATGDGDHWANLYAGFKAIELKKDSLISLDIDGVFKNVGLLMMSSIGGSSGALYGTAYLAAAKVLKNETLNIKTLYVALNEMLSSMESRGKAVPGDKTMIDSLYVGITEYSKGIENNLSEELIISNFIKGVNFGAQSTKEMQATKGRASYRTDKGVGFLDPGAVTMALQMECLGTFIERKIKNETN